MGKGVGGRAGGRGEGHGHTWKSFWRRLPGEGGKCKVGLLTIN